MISDKAGRSLQRISVTVPFSLMRRLVPPLGMALCAFMLAACGGGDAPGTQPEDPLAAFTQQTLQWQPCDPQALNFGFTPTSEMLAGARCALLRVPQDYEHPADGALQIELMRMEARQPRQRLGALVFNPGGPGAEGVAMGWAMSSLLARSGNARLREMADRYDMVGFSPRGTGSQNLLHCDINGALGALGVDEKAEITRLLYGDEAQAQMALQRLMQLYVQSCMDNPLSRHVHTDGTARDMDVLRAALGEDKLNFIGYSYGSWLGAWYSRLFPARAGRMLLDSSLSIRSVDDWLAPSRLGKQRIVERFMLPLVMRYHQMLGLDTADLWNTLPALHPRLKKVLVSTLNFSQSSELQNAALAIRAALVLQALHDKYADATLEEVQAMVRTSVFAPDASANAQGMKIALHMLNGLVDPGADAAPGNERLNSSVNISVRCNDTGSKGDAQYYLNRIQQDRRLYPLFDSVVAEPCAHWTLPLRTFPPAPAGEGAPLLMLQSRYDGQTPVEGAMETWTALPQARMIVVEDEYQHGLFPYGTDCVDNQLADYFLQGTLPQRLGSCAARQQY